MNAPSRRRGLAAIVLMIVLCSVAPAANTFTSAYISEFLADNQHGLLDAEGRPQGWIELHNGGFSPVNLAGWFLTDDPTNLTKWRFPAVGLLPDKYLIVFTSGQSRTNDLTALHTNFRLKQEGGYLALINSSTNIVSEFAPRYPAQSTDRSFGSVRGEPSRRGEFTRPTPGRPNAIRGKEFAGEVAFSKTGGSFTAPFTLELRTGGRKAVIHYTRDGSMPSTNSPAYQAPLLITNTSHIRARAFERGRLPGPPHSEAYLFLSTNALNFTSTLPVIVLETFGRSSPVSAHDSFAHVSVYEPARGRTSLSNPPALAARAGFHVRGSTSSGLPQSGFALEFVDEFNAGEARPLLGLPADSEWVLYAPNVYDPVMIHNPFIHQLSRDMGRYSPRTRFVEVFLARNAGPLREADYNGLYVLEEKIKIARNRVGIDRIGADDLKPPNVTGGYLMKFDRVGPGEGGFWGSGERGLVYVEPKEQTIMLPQRAPQREYLYSFMRDFHRALHGTNWLDPVRGYRAYLDVDAAIDFHVLEVLSGNVDAMVLSTYFHKPRNGKIICGPHWDFDRALGSTDGRDDNPRNWNTGPFFGGEWWPRLFSDPDFWQLWVDRWQDLRRNHFSRTNLEALIDRLANEVREAQPREYNRWNLQARGGSYQSEIDLMKSWLSNRIDFIDGQLVQPPRFARESGAVPADFKLVMTAAPEAKIYYTLDGSDPRLPQGGVSSSALVFTNPLPLTASADVVARAYDSNIRQVGGPPVSTPWSSPVTARHLVTGRPRKR